MKPCTIVEIAPSRRCVSLQQLWKPWASSAPRPAVGPVPRGKWPYYLALHNALGPAPTLAVGKGEAKAARSVPQ